jgi:hypothetical protein
MQFGLSCMSSVAVSIFNIDVICRPSRFASRQRQREQGASEHSAANISGTSTPDRRDSSSIAV